ncbi:hypothetical protein [Mycolicibacterium lutetiense]|uniref:Uncharacterized protein n=1 Tax=Mycolicibacterium lutetiense TaxID=1641992 RepID=A0ABS4ZSK0_9MYCO|nr:hypothetical protein [Mycolicibacterium lutetiense]MBP2452502.1 hypothetical protein [Mycolicibacterium lutetiense]
MTTRRVTLPAAALASVLASVLAAVVLVGCGSPTTTPTYTPPAAAPSTITHTSRVPKVVSLPPVPVRRPVPYNARLAVRYAAWAELRAHCDQRFLDAGKRGACANKVDSDFADVAYNVRAREEASKVGQFSTVYSTPRPITSYSTTTSLEVRRPTPPWTPATTDADDASGFAGVPPVVIGGGLVAVVLGTITVVVVRRRGAGYRPTHAGAGPSSYDTDFDMDDLSSPTDFNTDYTDDHR